MSAYIYVLFSLKDNKTYTGSTDDLERRLSEHTSGKVFSTKNRLPVRLLYFEEYKTLEEARYIEKYYKSCAGRKKLKLLLENRI